VLSNIEVQGSFYQLNDTKSIKRISFMAQAEEYDLFIHFDCYDNKNKSPVL